MTDYQFGCKLLKQTACWEGWLYFAKPKPMEIKNRLRRMKSHLKVHDSQHIAAEGFGSCYEFLKQHQAEVTATEFFALPLDQPLGIEVLPAVEGVDLLIIMGEP